MKPKPLIPRRIAYADLAAHLSYTFQDWTRGYKLKLPPVMAAMVEWCGRRYKENDRSGDTVGDFYFKELFPKFQAMTKEEREAVLLQMPSGFYRAEFRMHHMIASGKYEIIGGRSYAVEDYSI